MSDIKPKSEPITDEINTGLEGLTKQLDEKLTLDEKFSQNHETNEKRNETKKEKMKSGMKTDKISHEELEYWFEILDDKHFGGKLAEYKVQVKWSNKLHVNPGKVDFGNDGNTIEIKISRKLLESRPKSELVEALHQQMERTYGLVTDNKLKLNEEKRKKRLILNKKVNNSEYNAIPYIKQHLANNIGEKEDPKVVELEEKIQEIESKSLVDYRLEELDPKPNLQKMFKRYDKQYFDGILNKNNVEVNWSMRLDTQLMGLTYEADSLFPIQIRISAQLNTSRRDIVETLLHEMIHAFLYLKKDLEPYRAHGPVFRQMAKELHITTGANPLSENCLVPIAKLIEFFCQKSKK